MNTESSIEFSAVFLVALIIGRAGLRGLPVWRAPLAVFVIVLAGVFAFHMSAQYLESSAEAANERRNPPSLRVRGDVIPGRYDPARGHIVWTLPDGQERAAPARTLDWSPQPALHGVYRVSIVGAGLGAVLWVGGFAVRKIRGRRKRA